eukprot:c29800_g1_i1 orf=97-276(-)
MLYSSITFTNLQLPVPNRVAHISPDQIRKTNKTMTFGEKYSKQVSNKDVSIIHVANISC